MSINPDTRITSMQAFAGDMETTHVMLQYFGNSLQGGVPWKRHLELLEPLKKGVLVKGNYSIYVQTTGRSRDISVMKLRNACRSKRVTQSAAYVRQGPYGNIGLHFRHDNDLINQETVEAFVRQAGVALQRRYLKEKLRKAEERIRVLEGMTSPPGVADQVTPIREGNEAGPLNLPGGPLV